MYTNVISGVRNTETVYKVQYYKVRLHLLPLPLVKGEHGWLLFHPVCALWFIFSLCIPLYHGGLLQHDADGRDDAPHDARDARHAPR